MTSQHHRRKGKGPIRPFYGREKMRAAFMAGQGMSGGEIAEILGGTTGGKIRSMLHNAGIRMLRRPGDHDVVRYDCTRKEGRALREAAFARDLDPSQLARTIVARALEFPVLVDNLLDEGNEE
jgi:hypothetical protein